MLKIWLLSSQVFAICHTSHVARHTSHVARHTSHVTRRTSHVTRHTSHVARHTSHVTRHTSHVTRHTSHVTRHTSHVARRTSHVTRRTSHVTRRTSHAIAGSAPLLSFLSIMHNPATGARFSDLYFALIVWVHARHTIAAPYYLKTKAHVLQYRHR